MNDSARPSPASHHTTCLERVAVMRMTIRNLTGKLPEADQESIVRLVDFAVSALNRTSTRCR